MNVVKRQAGLGRVGLGAYDLMSILARKLYSIGVQRRSVGHVLAWPKYGAGLFKGGASFRCMVKVLSCRRISIALEYFGCYRIRLWNGDKIYRVNRIYAQMSYICRVKHSLRSLPQTERAFWSFRTGQGIIVR